MHELMAEVTISCPTCWEQNTISIDLSATPESLIEDCQVCCNPMTITLTVADGEIVSIESELTQ